MKLNCYKWVAYEIGTGVKHDGIIRERSVMHVFMILQASNLDPSVIKQIEFQEYKKYNNIYNKIGSSIKLAKIVDKPDKSKKFRLYAIILIALISILLIFKYVI